MTDLGNLWQVAIVIIGSIGSMGILVGGAGYFLQVWRSGSKKEKSEIVNSSNEIAGFWEKQANGYKTMMNEKEATLQKQLIEKDERTQKQINELTRQVGELRGQLNAKTEQASEYLAILQGKDETSKKFMETMLNVAKSSQKFMEENIVFQKEQAGIMEEIRAFMSNINTHLEAPDKDLKIEATVSKAI